MFGYSNSSYGSSILKWWMKGNFTNREKASLDNCPKSGWGVQKKLLPIFAAALFFCSMGVSEAAAATYYVWEGANGSNNGTSWANAWTSLSSTSNISAGDTVYIAQGQYGSLSASDANATYLRATASDHGSDSGWSGEMDGRVILSGIIDINADGVTVDGRTEYGIKVNGGSANGAIDIYGDQDNVTVKYIELDGSGEPGGPCSWRGMRVHDAYGGGYVDNLTVSHIYMHNYYNDCIKWVDVRDSVIEYTTFGPRSGSCSEHGDAMEIFGSSSNITLRYSRFNWNGQQIFFGAGSKSNNWMIYGNVFHDGTSASGVGIHPKAQSDTTGSLTIYNNTFYNMNRAHDITGYYSGTAKNNLYYDTGTRSYGGLSSSDNLVASSNPFVSASSDNFRLASATAAGDSSLSSAYSRTRMEKRVVMTEIGISGPLNSDPAETGEAQIHYRNRNRIRHRLPCRNLPV